MTGAPGSRHAIRTESGDQSTDSEGDEPPAPQEGCRSRRIAGIEHDTEHQRGERAGAEAEERAEGEGGAKVADVHLLGQGRREHRGVSQRGERVEGAEQTEDWRREAGEPSERERAGGADGRQGHEDRAAPQGVREATQTVVMKRVIPVEASVRFVAIKRASGPGPSGWPGGFVQEPLGAWAVKVGDFVTVRVERKGTQAVATRVAVTATAQ
jgi:hypothetical protein